MDEFQHLLNARVPIAMDDNSESDETLSDQHQISKPANETVTPSGFLMESCQKVGVGVSWLHHVSKSRSNLISPDGQKLLLELLDDHGLGEDEDDEIPEQECSWDFFGMSGLEKVERSSLFRTIIAIIQKDASKSNDDDASTDESSRYCLTNHIIQECNKKISKEENILRPIDIPVSLDSAHTIYAALIFLSTAIDSHEAVKEFFPSMPILQKNRLSSGLENIYPGLFAICKTVDVNEEFLQKLDCLEAFFFKSFTGESEYASRLRVVPRSLKTGLDGISEEQSALKSREMKKISRKRRKVDKDPEPADGRSASVNK